MRAGTLKFAAQYTGGLLIAAGFVALLSLIFSFLGTLFCAALAGMMLGTLRTHRWQAVPVSLMFPLVLLVTLRFLKAELPDRQILVMCLVCLFGFWLTFGAAAALFLFEHQPHRKSASLPAKDPLVQACPVGKLPATAADAAPPGAAALLCPFSLSMLQGSWALEAGPSLGLRNRRLCFQREQLTLSATNASGQVEILARAEVELRAAHPLSVLQISELEAGPASDSCVSI